MGRGLWVRVCRGLGPQGGIEWSVTAHVSIVASMSYVSKAGESPSKMEVSSLLSKVGVSPLTQSTKVEAAPSDQPNTQLGVVPPVKTSNGWLRTTLPAPQANIEDVSLWGILRNNIGMCVVCVCVSVWYVWCVCVCGMCVHVCVSVCVCVCCVCDLCPWY